jgi:hypothetical protein
MLGTSMDYGAIGVAEKMVFRLSCHRGGMLTFGYNLPRQALVHNPYYSALYFMLVH